MCIFKFEIVAFSKAIGNAMNYRTRGQAKPLKGSSTLDDIPLPRADIEA
jgi:hypothetical protein